MTTTGSMTAAVWLAPMVPKLPLPLAQRVQRLLAAEPGAATQAQALRLCEAIVAYAAVMRASVAAAVVPAGRRATLVAGVAEFRRVIERREATIADFRDLLLAAADAIEEIEPGHPLGRSEVDRPRPAWVARTRLVEALGDEFDEDLKGRVVDGGVAGILELWVELVEAPERADAQAWLGPLTDLIVDLLNSAALGEASLSYPKPGTGAAIAELRLLHGLASEVDPSPAEVDAYEPGVVCWRFDARVISACGLSSFWVDEHAVEHVGIVVKQVGAGEYLDFGTDARSPATRTDRVAWTALRVGEVAVVQPPSSTPTLAIAAGVLLALVLAGGITWAVWPERDVERAQGSSDSALASKAAKQSEPPEPELVDEIIIEGEQPQPDPQLGLRRPSAADETEESGLEAATASLWFESERSLGTCQITYEGRTRTANLHLKTRQLPGKLEFSYRCGEHRGRGTIDVKSNRVNGVLFCKNDGAVKVKTVRSNEGRCDR